MPPRFRNSLQKAARALAIFAPVFLAVSSGRTAPECVVGPGCVPPIVIAHRGASGYVPENTLESYRRAVEQGADYIEVDLISTRDGVLIARHDAELQRTTDVAAHPEFASRRRETFVDGSLQKGFFASDFTLQEIKSLQVVKSVANRADGDDSSIQVPTLDEILQLVHEESERTGRKIGLYVETKHPSYHRLLGLPLEDRLLAALKRAGLDQPTAHVFVESFEPSSLIYMHARSPLPMIQLVGMSGLDVDGHPMLKPPFDRPYDFTLAHDRRTYADLLTPHGLRDVARYAAGIGPEKSYLLPTRCAPNDANGCDGSHRLSMAPTRIVADAHAAGLLVHPYTFHSDVRRLAPDQQNASLHEYQAFFDLGVDGVITDFPDTAVLARKFNGAQLRVAMTRVP